MGAFGIIEWEDYPEPGAAYVPKYKRTEVKLPCFAEGALYESLECRVLMTTTEEYEWGALSLALDCDGPPDNHWLSYELENCCEIGDMIYISGGEETDMFLLEHGIAPFQRFYMHLTASYTKDYWGEHDSEFDYEVLNVEPWNENRIATEWEAYWARKRVIMPWVIGNK